MFQNSPAGGVLVINKINKIGVLLNSDKWLWGYIAIYWDVAPLYEKIFEESPKNFILYAVIFISKQSYVINLLNNKIHGAFWFSYKKNLSS